MRKSGLKSPLGVHVSIAGGYVAALRRGQALGCSCMQIFASNPRGWDVKSPSKKDAASFRAERLASGMSPLVVHVPYLVNLSSPSDDVYEKSISRFMTEFAIAEAIGAEYLVAHLGSPLDKGLAYGAPRVIAALKEVSKTTAGSKTRILLENTSGAGSGFGGDISEIGRIIKACRSFKASIGLCLDTCHAFAAGYPLKTRKDVDRMLGEVDSFAGIGSLKLIHLNDSKGALGSRLDRHQHIGKGYIGMTGFKAFLSHPCVRGLPLILETPKGVFPPKKGDKDDIKNLKTVASLLGH